MSICLDAYAILAWLQNETGADEVENCFQRAISSPEFFCFLSTINLGEVYFRLVRARGTEEADSFWKDANRGSLPVTLVEPTKNRIKEAARIKALYPVACADAFAAQLAREKNIPVITGDPEMKLLEDKKIIAVTWIGV